jgi:hypothetical protein
LLVTLCAISAAFAATSTSLLCILLLKNNNSGDGIFDGRTQLKQSFAFGPNRTDQKPVSRAAIVQRKMSAVTPDDNSGAELSKTSTEVNGIKRDDNKKKALGFNPSKDLDFAIIGWPKTGKRHRSDLSHVTS